MGAQQRTGLDAGKVGDQATEAIDHPLDGAEQVGVGWRILHQDGRACGGRVIHHHVDLVLQEGILLARRGKREGHGRAWALRLLEVIQVLDDVSFDLSQVVVDLGVVHLPGDLSQERGEERLAKAFLDRAHVLGHGTQDLLLLAGKRGQLLGDLPLVGFDRLLLLRAQTGELIRALQGPAVDDGNQQEITAWPGLDEKAFLPGAGLHLGGQCLRLGGILVLELGFFFIERLLAKGLGQFFAQGLDELTHEMLETRASSRSQGDGAGRIRMGKVMHVHPIP